MDENSRSRTRSLAPPVRYSVRPSAWPGSDGSLVHGVADWVDRRVDPNNGAPREWVVGVCAWIFQEPRWRVSVALATVIGERRARTESVHGTTLVFPGRRRSQ